ncbi:MAG TPA: TadE family protein [Acidimicrobiales bacterium]|nr:TadE family protein [Acidimicrobiales bacterium]
MERVADRQATWLGRAPGRPIRMVRHRSVRDRPARDRERRADGEDGASLVEFALVLPVFALLLFATIDFGLVFAGFVTLRGGAESGARLASVDQYAYTGPCTGGPDAVTRQMVCQVVSRIGSTIGIVTNSLSVGISLPQGTMQIGNNVEICAKATLHSTTGLTAPFLNGKTISTSSTVRIEQDASTTGQAYGPFNAASPPVVVGSTTVNGMTCA